MTDVVYSVSACGKAGRGEGGERTESLLQCGIQPAYCGVTVVVVYWPPVRGVGDRKLRGWLSGNDVIILPPCVSCTYVV